MFVFLGIVKLKLLFLSGGFFLKLLKFSIDIWLKELCSFMVIGVLFFRLMLMLLKVVFLFLGMVCSYFRLFLVLVFFKVKFFFRLLLLKRMVVGEEFSVLFSFLVVIWLRFLL